MSIKIFLFLEILAFLFLAVALSEPRPSTKIQTVTRPWVCRDVDLHGQVDEGGVYWFYVTKPSKSFQVNGMWRSADGAMSQSSYERLFPQCFWLRDRGGPIQIRIGG